MSGLVELRVLMPVQSAEELRRRYRVFLSGAGRHVDFALWAGQKFAGTIPAGEGL